MATEKRLVLGLTGPISGGKGTVAGLLAKGFFNTSLSDRIREEITNRRQEITRERLQDVGDELRREFGSNVLAQRTWELVSQKEKSVVDSIRTLGEVEYLKQKPGFILIGVTAPRDLRFKRVRERVRSGEPVTWEEFLRLDEKDFNSGVNGDGRDIQGCLNQANYLIENTGTLEDLKGKLEEILKKIM